jgi:3-hydroxyisobutyrate dehydrogenase-like beta-hydroxyacid dehydrogenase
VKVGFIGLGIMGSRMAKNLQKEGIELVVHNRSKDKAQELLDKGATWADSPREVTEQANIFFTMLSNPDVVREVALGEDGLLTDIAKGKLWVDSSTVHPAFTKEMASMAKKAGVRFLDAPVAGSKIPAENGELVFHVGGDKNDLEEVHSMLLAMGKAVEHQGENGMGSSMKIVINLMLAQSMATFAEALAFGEALGFEQEHVMTTLLDGPTTAPFLSGKKEKLLSGNTDPEFPLEHMQKDIHLVAQTAFEIGISLPIANVTKEVYALAKQHGYSKKDMSAIYSFLKEKK